MQSNFNDLKLLTKLRAHNNLGRLYILQKQYRAAWTPLEQALSFINTTDRDQFLDPLDPDATWDEILYEKYNILKNLGWLRVEQVHFLEADGYLQEAIEIGQTLGKKLKTDAALQKKLERNGQPAAAYCLEAQALEGLKQNQEALEFWANCERYGVFKDPDEAKWMAVAQERLAGIGPAEATE